jgi:hypothetical protein
MRLGNSIRAVSLKISNYYTNKDRYPREKPNQIQIAELGLNAGARFVKRSMFTHSGIIAMSGFIENRCSYFL